MFGLSFEKLFVLVVVALFVLGPERLPAAAAWAGQTIRKVKGFASGASEQLRSEFGPEFDQLRQPLQELRAPLQELRALRDPRAAIVKHLLSDPAPPPSGTIDLIKPVPVVAGAAAAPRPTAPPFDGDAT